MTNSQVPPSDEVPQWSDDAVAEAFRSEIRARFEAHNVAYRAGEARDLEKALREHPQYRGQPGFEVRDSAAWEVYQASEIRIDRNVVTIVLPSWYSVGIDLVFLFDNTTVAWSRPTIGATIVDGEPRVTVEITLVATWTDEMAIKWREDGRAGKRILVELYEDDVQKILDVLPGEGTDRIRKQLELARMPLP